MIFQFRLSVVISKHSRYTMICKDNVRIMTTPKEVFQETVVLG